MDKKIIIPTGYFPKDGKTLAGVAKGAVQAVIDKAIQGIPADFPEAKTAANILAHPSSALNTIKEYLMEANPREPAKPVKQYAIEAGKQSMEGVAGPTIGGKPIYSNLEIEAGSYTDFSGVEQKFGIFVFDTVLIKCKQQKSIIQTQVQGSDDGAVLEYSGLNGYDVDITATVVGSQNGIYPSQDVQNLLKVLTAQASLKVSSWYLQMLNIYEVVVTGFNLDQVEGGISQQALTINCKSNHRATLIIQ